MRLGIVGTGKMGCEIEAVAASRGHEVVWKLGSKDNPSGSGLTASRLSGADVIFEFTTPGSAVDNLLALGGRGPGSSAARRDGARISRGSRRRFLRGGGSLVHAANFSVGVRHFFELATRAARLFAPAGYAAYLVEEHHADKNDAPSGTARTRRHASSRWRRASRCRSRACARERSRARTGWSSSRRRTRSRSSIAPGAAPALPGAPSGPPRGSRDARACRNSETCSRRWPEPREQAGNGEAL